MPIVYRSGNFDHIDWKVPIEHFLWDRLAEAHAEASAIAVGARGEYLAWYRMIEAEWLTRANSEIVTVNPWLRLEMPGEPHPEVGEKIAEICEATARSFGVSDRPEILVTVLSEESDAPWVDGRAGYFIDKYPYDKICIPFRSLFDLDDFEEVVAHEYTHALNLLLTQAKCPLWLNEGMAMLSQRQLDPRLRMAFASGQAPWRGPHPLDAAFHAEVRGERDYGGIHRAYEQAAWIVRYLLTLGGKEKLGELMRAFDDNSLLTELKMRLVNEDPADEALMQVYGLRQDSLFERALEWLPSQR